MAVLAGLGLLTTGEKVEGAATPLALKCGAGTCTVRMVSDTFGTELTGLPFSGTTTYNFYSPPFATAISLTTSGKGGGVIYMRNNSTTVANDFSVSGRMQYYDYDPSSGASTLIVDTTASPHKDVNHGQTVNWAIPNALLPASVVLPAGHLLRVAVMVALLAGDPGGYGELLYNGPSGSTTIALFPQNATLTWSFAPPMPAPQASATPATGGSMSVSFSGVPGLTYTVQATTNLSNPAWIIIGSAQASPNGLMSFVDADAKSYPCRFYRVFSQ